MNFMKLVQSACDHAATLGLGSRNRQARDGICCMLQPCWDQDPGCIPGVGGLEASALDGSWIGRPSITLPGGDRASRGEPEWGSVGGPGVTSRSSRWFPASKQAPCLQSRVPCASAGEGQLVFCVHCVRRLFSSALSI